MANLKQLKLRVQEGTPFGPLDNVANNQVLSGVQVTVWAHFDGAPDWSEIQTLGDEIAKALRGPHVGGEIGPITF